MQSKAITRPSTPLRGIVLKLLSVASFVIMATCLKATQTMPIGQLVFGRSFFSLIPILIFLAWRHELIAGLKTKRFGAHLGRSMLGTTAMVCGFTALILLPLPDATAIGFANPLFVVILSAILLQEQVRIYRWSAVLLGFVGVLIIIWPRLTILTQPQDLQFGETLGVAASLAGAFVGAFAMLSVRKLVTTERSATIVIYFACFTSLFSLVSLPFGWVWPSPQEGALLIASGIAGGFGQALLTESYRHADASTIAPFDYTALIWTVIIGYFLFADIPTLNMLVGALITIGAGLFVIWRERERGIDRSKQRKVSSPHN